MIVTDLQMQAMHCDVCQECYEIPRKLMRDQHALVEMADSLRHDHRECAANRDNPTLAAASRTFRKRVEREFARSAA